MPHTYSIHLYQYHIHMYVFEHIYLSTKYLVPHTYNIHLFQYHIHTTYIYLTYNIHLSKYNICRFKHNIHTYPKTFDTRIHTCVYTRGCICCHQTCCTQTPTHTHSIHLCIRIDRSTPLAFPHHTTCRLHTAYLHVYVYMHIRTCMHICTYIRACSVGMPTNDADARSPTHATATRRDCGSGTRTSGRQ